MFHSLLIKVVVYTIKRKEEKNERKNEKLKTFGGNLRKVSSLRKNHFLINENGPSQVKAWKLKSRRKSAIGFRNVNDANQRKNFSLSFSLKQFNFFLSVLHIYFNCLFILNLPQNHKKVFFISKDRFTVVVIMPWVVAKINTFSSFFGYLY